MSLVCVDVIDTNHTLDTVDSENKESPVLPDKFMVKLKLVKHSVKRHCAGNQHNLETHFLALSDVHRVRLINVLVLSIRSKIRTFKKICQTYLYGICEAKTSLGTICHRRCQNILDDYCSTHLKNPLKFDHVEKRERTPKAKLDFSQVDRKDYFEVELKEINNELVYVDQFGLIYRKLDYTIIGIIHDNGEIEKF